MIAYIGVINQEEQEDVKRTRVRMETIRSPAFFTSVVGAFVILFVFLRNFNEWFYVKALGKKRHELPPGDMGWPLVGTTISFARSLMLRDPDSYISSFVSRYGRTGIYRTVMYGKPSIIVCTSDTCRRAFTDAENFKMSYPLAVQGLVGPKSFHNLSNAEHRHYRRLTASVISGSETLSGYMAHIEEVMISSLESWSEEGRAVEFATEMKKVGFNAVLPFVCGPFAVTFAERMMKLLDEVIDGIGLLNINLPGFKFHKALKARLELTEILREVLDATRSAKEQVKVGKIRSMMDVLLSSKKEDGQPVGEENILDLIHMYIFASYPSVTAVASMIMWHLHRNPDILDKAKDEQVRILERRDSAQNGLSFQEIKQMEYLAKVIDEVLRISQASHLFREATADVNLNGYLVPKGWKILVWVRAVHMDPKNYPNPEEFDPPRWEDGEKKGATFLPFGAGRRVCPGSDLAKLELCIFLHHFLLNYEVERINPDCPINYALLPVPADKFLVRFRKAKDVRRAGTEG
ncbi:hypothetical protein MLD38_005964 [Melastoma candidum]|uniref:Uncharacterized protein n=1 Tax=Melastoma candidum TaxID=119954 RepID=A0ACB9RUU1_9MYRT|nr:hypothetical protein MLD38_005964 [Melastoma candidum]